MPSLISSKSQRRGVYLVSVASVFALVLTTFDVWRIQGHIVSRETRTPIPNADVLVSLRYRDRESLVPHAAIAKSHCVASMLVRSGNDGSFSASYFSLGLPWKRKGIAVEVFRPGWYLEAPVRLEAKTGVVAQEPISIELHPDRQERWSFVHDGGMTDTLTDDPASPLYQRTMSLALTRSANMVAPESACDHNGWMFASRVLRYVIANAKTLDEKRYIHLRCVRARNLLVARSSAHVAEIPFSEDLSAGMCGTVLNWTESIENDRRKTDST